MNIFFLDTNIKKSCQYHCDKHTVKMVLEYGQILSTAHHIIDGHNSKIIDDIYKPTHINHPSVKWVYSHYSHYETLYKMLCQLSQEYTFRYGKQHATSKLLKILQSPPKAINTAGIIYTKGDLKYNELPPQCMNEQYKVKPKNQNDINAVIIAYRLYYINEKTAILYYCNRNMPKWIK